jgi:hypothetical protein
LGPNVLEMIAAYQPGGAWMSHLEIHRAIMSGRIKDQHQLTGENCWAVTVLGNDSDGEPLGVMLNLPVDRLAPVKILQVYFFMHPGFQLEAPDGPE